MSKDSESAVMIVLGNQLFPKKFFKKYKDIPLFMAEDHELCTHFKYHKHKILLFLIAMRRFKDELIEEGFDVTYREMPPKDTLKAAYMSALADFIKEKKATKLIVFEVEDTFFEKQIIELSKKCHVELEFVPSPFFMVTRKEFEEYLASVKKPFMRTFYERLRKKTGILMEKGKPEGGKY
ncbi:MAG: cryptochrome/photolyase family protein, partial [Halobacteriovoraceae bacterium]|nr:cryptochrome/photolyase family protein [Halobacteriovoraceae bacterium]